MSTDTDLLTKDGREACWGARDKYWECLEVNEEQQESCLKTRKDYEQFCSKQWVKHFDRRRKYEKFKEEMTKKGWNTDLDERSFTSKGSTESK